jgi:hypothetical protein
MEPSRKDIYREYIVLLVSSPLRFQYGFELTHTKTRTFEILEWNEADMSKKSLLNLK